MWCVCATGTSECLRSFERTRKRGEEKSEEKKRNRSEQVKVKKEKEIKLPVKVEWMTFIASIAASFVDEIKYIDSIVCQYLPHSYRGQHSSGDLTRVQFCPSMGLSVS